MPDHPQGLALSTVLVGLLGAAAVLGYLAAVRRTRLGPWPRWRTTWWVAGVVVAEAAVVGPLPTAAHHSFGLHMVGHLLLGMIAPLLMSLAAPVTLALQVLPVASGRRLATVLRSRVVRVLTEPVVTAALSVGGLWLLYTTSLYATMADSAGIHVAVHVHVFVAGYLFTVAMVGTDPAPHRRPPLHRALVWVVAVAAHDILAKRLYAGGVVGVGRAQAETGAMIMYYGGDAVSLVVLVILAVRTYRASGRRLHGVGISRTVQNSS